MPKGIDNPEVRVPNPPQGKGGGKKGVPIYDYCANPGCKARIKKNRWECPKCGTPISGIKSKISKYSSLIDLLKGAGFESQDYGFMEVDSVNFSIARGRQGRRYVKARLYATGGQDNKAFIDEGIWLPPEYSGRGANLGKKIFRTYLPDEELPDCIEKQVHALSARARFPKSVHIDFSGKYPQITRRVFNG